MNIFLIKSVVVISLLLGIVSCKPENEYIYQVNPISVKQDRGNKTNVKTTIEFITIAYTDLFSASISQAELDKLSFCYQSVGDKKLIEDMIIKNFLKRSSVNIPTTATMRSDIPLFIKNTYIKLYNRIPDATEQNLLVTKIEQNTTITAAIVYYAMMTSNEYRYY